jgi:hypothetical protein
MRRVRVASALLSSIFAVILGVFPEAASAQSALSNGGNHIAVLQVGGLDSWTFTATKNDGIAVSLGKAPGNVESNFYPWLRLKGPDGLLLRETYAVYGDTNSVDVDQRAPLTGVYTVLVASRNSSQASPASYVLTLARTAGPYSVSAGDEVVL